MSQSAWTLIRYSAGAVSELFTKRRSSAIKCWAYEPSCIKLIRMRNPLMYHERQGKIFFKFTYKLNLMLPSGWNWPFQCWGYTFVPSTRMQRILITTLTLSSWHWLDSSCWVLSDEYPYARVSVNFHGFFASRSELTHTPGIRGVRNTA